MYTTNEDKDVPMPTFLMRVISKTGLFTNLGTILYPVIGTTLWIVAVFLAKDVWMPQDHRYYYRSNSQIKYYEILFLQLY